MSPLSPRHATAIHKSARALAEAFQGQAYIRIQAPIVSQPSSEPEPDVAVVPGKMEDYTDRHPSRAMVILEVSDSSLHDDLYFKASFYASIGIADYWILNLIDRQLEVHRNPVADPSLQYGWRYASVENVPADGKFAPLATPDSFVRVADLLP